ncbi:MAG: 50S ribosomal protein L19 [Candidatus Harrisonbacteria bacterium]|nr:50S ribosomal protein L19 [Candidatus Harrisonbacteria bacterium]
MDDATMKQLRPGATVRVVERVSAEGGSASGGNKGDKERESSFEGLVLARKHGMQAGATFTVRGTVAGVGVEKVYPIHSPRIAKVHVLSSPKKVSRAKLYYIRNLSKKETRQKLGAAE